MICYRDRTYCPYYSKCNNPCDRAMTPEIVMDANMMGLPVCFFSEKQECFKEVKNAG